MHSIKLTDQLGNVINLTKPAQRIISLVPSQTELLLDLGVGNRVVGITKFCVHPSSWRREKQIVGGTKTHHLKKISELSPDLIIANKEENTQQLIERLQSTCPVYVSDISNLQQAFQMISDIGFLTNTQEQSSNIVEEIRNSFKDLSEKKANQPHIKVAYCIWRNPWMWVGKDTFINSLLDRCGFNNVISTTRYPEIDLYKIKEISPDYIFLSSEPYPFKQKHIEEIKTILPHIQVILVDGEYFSWYGSRLLKAPTYFLSLLKQVHLNTF